MTTTDAPWKCPECGTINPPALKLCGLCGHIKPRPEPIIETPPPAPPPPPVEQWNVPSTVPISSDAWGTPATVLAWAQPQPQEKASPLTIGLFIFALPWSLVVFLLPRGLKNKNAWWVIIAAFIIGTLLTIPLLAPLASHILSAAGGAGGSGLTDPTGGG